MARKQRKIIYYMGSVILSMLLFLAMFILDEDKSWNITMDESSSIPVPESSENIEISSKPEVSIEDELDVSIDSSAEDSSSVDIPPAESSSSELDEVDSSGNPPPDSTENSSDEGGNDSTEGGGGGGGGGPTYLFRVKTDEDFYGTMYLRENALAKYVGYGEHGFVEADWAYGLKNGERNPLTYFAKTLQESRYAPFTATVELNKVQGEYLPYYPWETLGSTMVKEYEVSYYPYDFLQNGLSGLTSFRDDPDMKEWEERYLEYVEENYLQIDNKLKTLLLRYARENGVDKDADIHTVALQVANYIQNAAYYTYKWAEKDYPLDKDMVTYFLDKEKNVGGVCRHFAAAATMTFRALGIPSRYTKGFAVPINGADVWTEWYGAGHAWTEIYIEGYGWVPLEVTGGNMMPDDSTEPPEIEDGDFPYAVLQESANPFGEKRYFQKIRKKEALV